MRAVLIKKNAPHREPIRRGNHEIIMIRTMERWSCVLRRAHYAVTTTSNQTKENCGLIKTNFKIGRNSVGRVKMVD